MYELIGRIKDPVHWKLKEKTRLTGIGMEAPKVQGIWSLVPEKYKTLTLERKEGPDGNPTYTYFLHTTIIHAAIVAQVHARPVNQYRTSSGTVFVFQTGPETPTIKLTAGQVLLLMQGVARDSRHLLYDNGFRMKLVMYRQGNWLGWRLLRDTDEVIDL